MTTGFKVDQQKKKMAAFISPFSPMPTALVWVLSSTFWIKIEVSFKKDFVDILSLMSFHN